MKVVMMVDSPSPIAFLDVYEDGDKWVKVVGCEGCEEIGRCCGSCPLLVPGKGCLLHLEAPTASRKPYHCIVRPAPDTNWKWCQQEWLCVRGEHKGQIRRIREPADVFQSS